VTQRVTRAPVELTQIGTLGVTGVNYSPRRGWNRGSGGWHGTCIQSRRNQPTLFPKES